jgi:N-acyl-D-aspartate/D-glutamate deacylase
VGRDPAHVHVVDHGAGRLDGFDGVEVVRGWRQDDVVFDPADMRRDVPYVVDDAPGAGGLSDVKDSQ